MMKSSLATAAAFAAVAAAQRTAGQSVCDYYTQATFGNDTAASQYQLITMLVNTLVIGSYPPPNGIQLPNTGVTVPGILTPGNINGTAVSLAGYFDGSLQSTNVNNVPTKVNFLDGGGAAPLKMNMPAQDTSSNQYFLLTHLYQFIGALTGCSQYGADSAFPNYMGHPSMARLHKYMDLDPYQFAYFVEQAGLALASFGVAASDIQAVAGALNSLFGYRCAPPTVVIPAQGAQLQSICEADSCPLAANATCAASSSAAPYSSSAAPRSSSAAPYPTGGPAANGSALGYVNGTTVTIPCKVCQSKTNTPPTPYPTTSPGGQGATITAPCPSGSTGAVPTNATSSMITPFMGTGVVSFGGLKVALTVGLGAVILAVLL